MKYELVQKQNLLQWRSRALMSDSPRRLRQLVSSPKEDSKLCPSYNLCTNVPRKIFWGDTLAQVPQDPVTLYGGLRAVGHYYYGTTSTSTMVMVSPPHATTRDSVEPSHVQWDNDSQSFLSLKSLHHRRPISSHPIKTNLEKNPKEETSKHVKVQRETLGTGTDLSKRAIQ